MEKKKDYFTIGEFGALFDVSKQTLQFYDKNGVFQPEYRAENGYRYYAFTQIETFEVLLMLRELDVPLKEIREHLKTPTPERFLALLDRQKAELENRMKKLEHTLEYIDYKRKVTEEGIHAPLRKVVFEQLRDEYLITTDYSGEDDARSIQTAVAKHFRFCREIGLTEQKAIGAIIPVDSVTEDSYHYSKFYTLVDPNEVAPTAGTEPIVDSGGSYIAVYDNKGYENICELCHLLLDYAKKNHLWLDDSFYEDVILDDFSVPGYYNYLVKVSIRVR
ncbi:MerR family transcriptional regulator [Eubacterium sp. AB3007]|uniref:MerR family transcriptional regulator n=1 Tax=Eubacterium sp. AB3007 TaxID=1392487 RepID=UPI00048559EA|nr:MerR family transcriptional regulator [Eubacterium sp. AB3007]MBQ1471661.1 MerR family transcriptional regulator [Eubacterium sp.]